MAHRRLCDAVLSSPLYSFQGNAEASNILPAGDAPRGKFLPPPPDADLDMAFTNSRDPQQFLFPGSQTPSPPHCPPSSGGAKAQRRDWHRGMNSIAEIDHALKQQGFENLQVRIPRDPISGSSRCSHAHKSLGGHRFGHPRGNSEVGWAFRKGGTKGRAGDLSDSSGQKLTFRAKNWCQHHARGCFQWRVTLQCGYFHERRATRGGLVALSDLPRHGSGEEGEERCHPQYFHRRSLPK